MTRYSGGSSDRPFWLEAYGGRGYTVERMGREPVYIDHLSVGVVGGIQPDRLRSLLLKTDDDGLLARFLPVFPEPAPIRRPAPFPDEAFLEESIEKLLGLQMPIGRRRRDAAVDRPVLARGAGPSRRVPRCGPVLGGVRRGPAPLLHGKLPGLAVRLSLILAYLDWTAGTGIEPVQITFDHFNRAAHLAEAYVLPMARRAYANGSMPKEERAARKLARLLHEKTDAVQHPGHPASRSRRPLDEGRARPCADSFWRTRRLSVPCPIRQAKGWPSQAPCFSRESRHLERTMTRFQRSAEHLEG